ncbi:transglutaminase-like domain-containing protein [Eubacteriales bacterium OttesenSCG-928-K08]|nr:transglutaminase-like domain-containing protein [Eubacteriales bacterium OttesenSCG-928-K08]
MKRIFKNTLLFLLAFSLLIPTVAYAAEYEWRYNEQTGLYDYVPVGSGETPAFTPTPKPTEKENTGGSGALLQVTDVPGNYKKGTVYGPKLSANELKQVKAAVVKAVNSCIREDMTDKQKIVALVNYLCDQCKFADDWSKNRANTAWGALVYGEAQCSGYARAMIALLDAVGIESKYVHASSKASNPSHQWIILKYEGAWYNLDPQMIDDYRRIVNGVVTYPRPIVLYGGEYMPAETKLPKMATKNITLQ